MGYALVFAQHVLPQLGGIARLVRTGGALVAHLVVALQAKRKNKMIFLYCKRKTNPTGTGAKKQVESRMETQR